MELEPSTHAYFLNLLDILFLALKLCVIEWQLGQITSKFISLQLPASPSMWFTSTSGLESTG